MCLASYANSHQGLTVPNFEGYTSRTNVQWCSASLPDPCLTYTMNSTHPRTPPCPRIDQTQSKGTPRRHKTPKRIRNLGIKAPHKSIHKIQEELKSKLKTFGHRVLQIFSIRAVGNLFTFLGPALGLYPMKMDALSLTALTSLWKVKVRSCRAETLRKQMSEKTR